MQQAVSVAMVSCTAAGVRSQGRWREKQRDRRHRLNTLALASARGAGQARGLPSV
jgi:hypothetical protein